MSEATSKQAKAELTTAAKSRDGCYNYSKTQEASMVSQRKTAVFNPVFCSRKMEIAHGLMYCSFTN